jgi:hypothetical protein
LTPQARDRFLELLGEGWSVSKAAKAAGSDRRRMYEARADDETFAAAWDEELERGTELLEDELRRRATEGWTEETRDGDGKVMRVVERYLPHLLVSLLKARRPELYRDNAPAVNVAVGQQVKVEVPDNSARMIDVLRFAKSLGSDVHDSVIRGLLGATSIHARLTPDELVELNELVKQTEASTPWSEHPAPLELEPGDPRTAGRTGFAASIAQLALGEGCIDGNLDRQATPRRGQAISEKPTRDVLTWARTCARAGWAEHFSAQSAALRA